MNCGKKRLHNDIISLHSPQLVHSVEGSSHSVHVTIMMRGGRGGGGGGGGGGGEDGMNMGTCMSSVKFKKKWSLSLSLSLFFSHHSPQKKERCAMVI